MSLAADTTNLSVQAKPWTPSGAGMGTFGVTSGPANPSMAIPTIQSSAAPLPPPPAYAGAPPSFPSISVGGSQLPSVGLPSAGAALPFVPGMMMGGGGFIPSITSGMPTRVSTRIPRGRGNSGRGLRAQQEMKSQAANVLPTYAVATGVPEEDSLEAPTEDDVYNPLAPMERREVDPEAFVTKAALDVIGEDSGAIGLSIVRSTPKMVKANNVIGSTHATPSVQQPITKPSPVFTPVPANSPFHQMVNAKPFVPPTPAGSNPQGITPPLGDAAGNESDSDAGSPGDDLKDLPGAGGASEALRVDADTFFTEAVVESHVKQAAKAFQKNEENPYSITSLQGVRATMPTIESTAWYPMRCGDEDIFLPAPFVPEHGHPPMGVSQHVSICHPPQYPQATLSLFYYLCYTCPITCQLSKLNDRPPDLKLGGICGDINPACIAHLVECLSGIKLIALDVFGHNFGRCNLWLQDPRDAPRMMASLDRRVWMSPVPHGYAVVVDDDDSREYLLWYLEGLREHGPRRVRFPRHLMTCEKWIV